MTGRTIRYAHVVCDCLHPIESTSTRSCKGCGQEIGHRTLVCPFCGARMACNACGNKVEENRVMEATA